MASVYYFYDAVHERGIEPPPFLRRIWKRYCALVEETPAEHRHFRTHEGHYTYIHPGEAELIDAELVRATCLVGTAEELIERIQELERGGLRELMLATGTDEKWRFSQELARTGCMARSSPPRGTFLRDRVRVSPRQTRRAQVGSRPVPAAARHDREPSGPHSREEATACGSLRISPSSPSCRHRRPWSPAPPRRRPRERGAHRRGAAAHRQLRQPRPAVPLGRADGRGHRQQRLPGSRRCRSGRARDSPGSAAPR